MPLALAVQFLTVLPAPVRRAPSPNDYHRSTGWYPLIGLVVGLPGAIVAFTLTGHLPPELLALTVLVMPILLTGALHLDGFADSCDGLFARRTPDQRRTIMKDSRLGTFGVVGVVLLLGARWIALSGLPTSALPAAALLAPCLGRWSMVLSLHWFSPATPGVGLAALFAVRDSRWPLVAATLTAVLAAVVAVGLWAIVAVGGAALVAWLVGRFATARLGGVNGDVYGATNEGTELAVQLGLAVVATWR